MEILRHRNLAQFLAFFPKIKNSMSEWRLVNISLGKGSGGSIFSVARKLLGFLSHTDGQIIVCNSHELLALIKTGKSSDVELLKKDILGRLPEYDCTIAIVETTPDGLQKIELSFMKGEGEGIPEQKQGVSVMLQERQKRHKNIILIADDDLFVRTLLKKTLESHGTVTSLEDGTKVVDTYLEIMPDILILDIHLPGQSGFEILDEILMFDQDAYIIMLSSDSDKDNVLNTRKMGAKGFIAKPFTKEKLEEALWKCPTMTRKGESK
jgi:two-component system chemotaxis response regulator CheY